MTFPSYPGIVTAIAGSGQTAMKVPHLLIFLRVTGALTPFGHTAVPTRHSNLCLDSRLQTSV
jgi:hypothetical protein